MTTNSKDQFESILRTIDPSIDYSRCSMDDEEHSFYITIRKDGDDSSNQMIDMDLLQTTFLDAVQYVNYHVGIPDGWHITLYEVR